MTAMTDTPIPDIGSMDDVQRAVSQVATLMQAQLQQVGATLGAMAVTWVVVEPCGNNAGCMVMGDDSPEVLEHMADCLLDVGGEWETLALKTPRSN